MSAGPAATLCKLASEYSELQPVVAKIRDYQKALAELADLEVMLADNRSIAMRDLAEMELPGVKETIETLETDIQILLLPKDAGEKSAILKFAPAQGSEAALFAGDLFRMYERYSL